MRRGEGQSACWVPIFHVKEVLYRKWRFMEQDINIHVAAIPEETNHPSDHLIVSLEIMEMGIGCNRAVVAMTYSISSNIMLQRSIVAVTDTHQRIYII